MEVHVNWKRLAGISALAVVAVLWIAGCPVKPPAKPVIVGADSTWTGSSAHFQVTTTSKGNWRAVMEWGDATDTTEDSYASGETADVYHVWTTAGDKTIKAMAILDATPSKASEWSDSKTVKVVLNNIPVIDLFQGPPVAVKDAPSFFEVKAHDADGDSMTVKIKFGDGKDTTSSFCTNPCSVDLSHVYSKVETIPAVATATDWKNASSAPDTVQVVVGTAGGVKWYWESTPDSSSLITSALLFWNGSDTVVCGANDDDGNYYEIACATGKTKHSASTHFGLSGDYTFNGYSAYCAATDHVIVGSDEGELYGLKATLGPGWYWPQRNSEDSLDYLEWGAPAISGSKIYVGHAGDSLSDSLFYLDDNGSQAARHTAYALHARFVDAPALDGSGNVYFGDDSGYLTKMDGTLTSPSWRIPLQLGHEIYSPVIGSDGTIYCASDTSQLFALNPTDGSPKWPSIQLNGDCPRVAVGPNNTLFVGTSLETFYAINGATGTIIWQKALGGGTAGLATTPIVATGGYVYVQDEDDVLYCINQADGTTIWSCDCTRYLPRSGSAPHRHHPRRLQLTDYNPNPTIGPNGDIYVIGADAVYCVAGYPEHVLDASAPWPKWQKTLWNTGQ
jgi:outer membrane protein assembly factor BamB